MLLSTRVVILFLVGVTGVGAFSLNSDGQNTFATKRAEISLRHHRHISEADVVDRRSLIWIAIGSVVASTTLSVPTPASAATGSKSLGEEYRQGTAALSEVDTAGPVPRDAYKKLPSGVIYADLRPGSGIDEAKEGSRVNLQWVLRKSNGYFVDSSEKNDGIPFIFTIGDGNAIKGLDEGIRGMKAGGVRRVLIPPSLAYVDGLDDGKPGPMPSGYGPRQQMRRVQGVRKDVPGEYVYLEVQLSRLR